MEHGPDRGGVSGEALAPPARRPRGAPVPPKKRSRSYLVFRLWALLALIVWNGAILHWIAAYRAFPPVWEAVPVLLCGFSAILLLFDLAAIRLPYSVFGAYERTPLPPGPPVRQAVFSWGSIGWLSATVPFLSWYVYPEGLGFCVAGLWEGFVPRDLIRDVTLRRGRARIVHDSPEVRSPLQVPAAIAEDLADPAVLAERGGPRRRNLLGLGVLVAIPALMIAVLSVVAVVEGSRAAVREEVLGLLGAVGEDPEVLVDGAPLSEGRRLLEALRTLDDLPAHHSHPCRRFAVVVRGRGTAVDLDLARDSSDPTEYWVYFPMRSFTDYNEIGRLRTRLLDPVPSAGLGRPRRERRR